MKNLIFILLVFFIVQCVTKSADEEVFVLHDSLFKIKNLNRTLLHPEDQKINFVVLDKKQKMKLILPIVTKDLGVDADFVLNNMTARFLSKQDMAIGYTAIMVGVGADDYESIFYILLDKKNNPVSHFLLSGGLCAGPNEVNDSLIQFCPIRQSFIKNSEIRTFVVTETIQPDSIISHPSIIDSVYYASIVQSDGQIKTTKVDSVRFRRQKVK